MEPEFVAGLEVWDRGDGEGGVAAGDLDVDLGADEVEACVDGEGGRGGAEQKGKNKESPHARHHRWSLDALGLRDCATLV